MIDQPGARAVVDVDEGDEPDDGDESPGQEPGQDIRSGGVRDERRWCVGQKLRFESLMERGTERTEGLRERRSSLAAVADRRAGRGCSTAAGERSAAVGLAP